MDAIALRAGSVMATIYPTAGGRLGQLAFDSTPVLRGPDNGAAEMGWGYWGSYALLPWSNRIPGGEFSFEGRALRVPVSWEDGSALHGLAARMPWTVERAEPGVAELSIDIDEGPYQVQGWQRFVVTDGGLEQQLGVTNRGSERVPAGLGIHPWFRVSDVRVPASLMWPGEPMPTGPPVAVGPPEDLRTARPVPPMDRCYTGLTERAVEVGGIRLSWDGPITQVVVYSGEPDWVCVEPVTMANDGFRLADERVPGAGVVGLDPGESLTVTYRFAPAG
ncbi:MAG: hypothetical protein H0U92_12820 [Actinobacteria bacterium]|nr:hypothetical protein [Actinomycetota bacterium]